MGGHSTTLIYKALCILSPAKAGLPGARQKESWTILSCLTSLKSPHRSIQRPPPPRSLSWLTWFESYLPRPANHSTLSFWPQWLHQLRWTNQSSTGLYMQILPSSRMSFLLEWLHRLIKPCGHAFYHILPFLTLSIPLPPTHTHLPKFTL